MKNQRWVWAAIFAVQTFTCVLQSVANEPHERTRHVLVIGIDGLRPDALERAETPNLDRLRREGMYAPLVSILPAPPRRTENDTCSGPSWSTILSGVWSDKHGVLDNKFEGRQFQKYPHFFAHLKTVHPAARTVSLVSSWEKINNFIVSGADRAEHISEHKIEKGFEGEIQRDEGIAGRVAKELAANDPTALFVYFHQVDTDGHLYGFHPSVELYRKAIENVDGCVGIVLDALAKRTNRSNEDWLIVVCTDHGGFGNDHSHGHENPDITNVFLILNGPTMVPGSVHADQAYIADVSVTALDYLGVPIDPAWSLDGCSLLPKPK